MTIYGLTPEGFNTPRLANVKQFLENDFVASFGDINTDPQSVAGQLIGIFSKMFADQWENLEDVYFSQYPNSASGVSLDNVVQLNGISRLAATQTNVTATCDGLEGTAIPANSLASIPSTGDTFYAPNGGVITRQNADIVKVQVNAITTQPYTVLIDSTPFTYSLPVITFANVGNIFVTGNVITVTLNGIALSPINFTTNSNATLAAIASAIAAFPTVSSATVVGTTQINIVSSFGLSTTVNSIQITGGATQATNVITFRAPPNNNAITGNLVGLINANTPSWLGVDNLDGTLTITANSPEVPFSCNVGVNLSIIYQASPVTFLCVEFGPVPCPIGTLTNIVTPIAGWNSITNLIAGATGTLVETDAQLRIRRQNSIKLLGAGTVEAITAGLLQKVPGVTSATVFENTSLQQDPIVVSFPGQFQSGDTITVVYNTVSNFTVPFTTNQATTMTNLVAAFQALPAVLSASFGGTGNQVVTIVMQVSDVLLVNSASTDVSALTATITGGRPPKSFEAVVEGGTNEAVANQIWLTKPAGIETYGNTEQPITDSQGNTQVIFFSRPSPIYIWVQVALTLYPEETFPPNGIQSVALAIFNYGQGLGVGIDVLLQRVLAQIFQVPGIASGVMQIAATTNISDSPSFATSDISIEDNQISVWDLDRISVTVS